MSNPKRVPRTKKAVALSAVTALTAALPVAAGPTSVEPPALALAGAGECSAYPAKQIKGTPWSLQRVMFDQLWQDTKGLDPQGHPVRVAVIDTGVDNTNPQLKGAVDAQHGSEVLGTGEKKLTKGKKGDGTDDSVGHGTKVAGIIAARPDSRTGFVGLAPEATIIPIRQNDDQGTGTTRTMAKAIDQAVEAGAQIINISQDTHQADQLDQRPREGHHARAGPGHRRGRLRRERRP